MYLLAIVSFGGVFVQTFCPFLSQIFCLLLMSCISSWCILDINPLSDIWLASTFSHSVTCLFVLLMASFALQKLFSLRESYCLFLLLLPLLLVSDPKNHHQFWCQGAYCLCFLLGSFRASGLIFKSLIHFELIFEYDVW